MRRKSDYDNTSITFTLTRAGCNSKPVTLKGKEMDDLVKRLKGKRVGPPTQEQAEAAALFVDFVRGGLKNK